MKILYFLLLLNGQSVNHSKIDSSFKKIDVNEIKKQIKKIEPYLGIFVHLVKELEELRLFMINYLTDFKKIYDNGLDIIKDMQKISMINSCYFDLLRYNQQLYKKIFDIFGNNIVNAYAKMRKELNLIIHLNQKYDSLNNSYDIMGSLSCLIKNLEEEFDLVLDTHSNFFDSTEDIRKYFEVNNFLSSTVFINDRFLNEDLRAYIGSVVDHHIQTQAIVNNLEELLKNLKTLCAILEYSRLVFKKNIPWKEKIQKNNLIKRFNSINQKRDYFKNILHYNNKLPFISHSRNIYQDKSSSRSNSLFSEYSIPFFEFTSDKNINNMFIKYYFEIYGIRGVLNSYMAQNYRQIEENTKLKDIKGYGNIYHIKDSKMEELFTFKISYRSIEYFLMSFPKFLEEYVKKLKYYFKKVYLPFIKNLNSEYEHIKSLINLSLRHNVSKKYYFERSELMNIVSPYFVDFYTVIEKINNLQSKISQCSFNLWNKVQNFNNAAFSLYFQIYFKMMESKMFFTEEKLLKMKNIGVFLNEKFNSKKLIEENLGIHNLKILSQYEKELENMIFIYLLKKYLNF